MPEHPPLLQRAPHWGSGTGVWVTAAVLNDRGAATSASLRFPESVGSLSAQGSSVSVDSVPTGVSLQMVPVSSGPGGLTLPLNVQAVSKAAQGDAWLTVHLSSQARLSLESGRLRRFPAGAAADTLTT